MGSFIKGLLYDNGKPSRSGFIGVAGFFLCVFAAFTVTAYIIIKGIKFDGYNEFLIWCRDIGLGCGLVQTANKTINAVAYTKCEEIKEAPKL